MIAAGLPAVGRPSNVGGVDLLVSLLSSVPDREIVVVGENDRKSDGLWPGRDGAIQVARQLTVSLGRLVRYSMPPDDAKDVREWLLRWSDVSWPDRGHLLAERLLATATAPDASPGDRGISPPISQLISPHHRPDDPQLIAQCYLRDQSQGWPVSLIRFWRSDFYRWTGSHYYRIDRDDIKAEVTNWIQREFEILAKLTVHGDQGEAKKAPRVTARLVADVLNSLAGYCLVPASTAAPAWLDGVVGPTPMSLLSLQNGILNIESGELLQATPSYFSLSACPYAYDPTVSEPTQWLAFLQSLWPDDPEAITSLQEWFGYLLSQDTSRHKILFLIGPKRSGKGTICRILEQMIGERNVAHPTLSSLAENFTLSSLLEKSVAIISDARLDQRHNVDVIAERLLSISGEDALTVDRKYRDAITVRFTTRIVIASNEIPRLADSSAALAYRFHIITISQSFYGREDRELPAKLARELPGILNWSLAGLRRLRSQRGFTVQPSGMEVHQRITEYLSPISAFVEECCVIQHDAEVLLNALYEAWRSWCYIQGYDQPGSLPSFSRRLHSYVHSLKIIRSRQTSIRQRVYRGIRLKGADE